MNFKSHRFSTVQCSWMDQLEVVNLLEHAFLSVNAGSSESMVDKAHAYIPGQFKVCKPWLPLLASTRIRPGPRFQSSSDAAGSTTKLVLQLYNPSSCCSRWSQRATSKEQDSLMSERPFGTWHSDSVKSGHKWYQCKFRGQTN